MTKEQYDELRALAPNVHIVRGGFDDDTTFPGLFVQLCFTFFCGENSSLLARRIESYPDWSIQGGLDPRSSDCSLG